MKGKLRSRECPACPLSHRDLRLLLGHVDKALWAPFGFWRIHDLWYRKYTKLHGNFWQVDFVSFRFSVQNLAKKIYKICRILRKLRKSKRDSITKKRSIKLTHLSLGRGQDTNTVGQSDQASPEMVPVVEWRPIVVGYRSLKDGSVTNREDLPQQASTGVKSHPFFPNMVFPSMPVNQ